MEPKSPPIAVGTFIDGISSVRLNAPPTLKIADARALVMELEAAIADAEWLARYAKARDDQLLETDGGAK
jgi:hypothetical protein